MKLLRRPAVLITGMTAALLAVQAIYMKETLLHVEGWGQAWALSALFALVFGAAMTAFSRLERPGAGTLAAVGGFLAAMMLARVDLVPRPRFSISCTAQRSEKTTFLLSVMTGTIRCGREA